jgi:hypothetical protein
MNIRLRSNHIRPNIGIISEIEGDFVLCDYDPVNTEDYDRAMIHKSLCVGFTPSVGQKVFFCENADVEFSKTYLAVIPKGIYCHDENVCPFWSINPDKLSQENGYCSFLKIGDWEVEPASFGLLWDQVKLCSENMDEEND